MSHLKLHLILSVVFLSSSVLYAADDGVTASRRNAIVTAIEKAAPAVVTINVIEIQSEELFVPFFDEFWGRFYRSPIRGRSIESIGSGFIIDDAGHILTNYHVIKDADHISSVTLADGRNLVLDFVGADPHTDIAVLRISDREKEKKANLPHVKLGDSEDLYTGEWVIAIGNPFGNMIDDPQPSVSVGVVSANHRRVSREIGGGEQLYQNMIQTDAAINPGNSGGPLVNALGEVVGINTMIFSSTGGNQGLGFAIPIDRAKRVAHEIIQYGRRRSPWLGFKARAVADLDDFSRRRLGITVDAGAIVTEMLKKDSQGRGVPAYEAGLRPGDVIIRINDQPVSHPEELDFANWELFVGDTVRLIVMRGDQQVQLTFKVKELSTS